MSASKSADDQIWDVVVVGGGPAGSSAAIAAHADGATVLLLDRETFPRDKLCGGGLLQVSVDALPAGFEIPERADIRRITFTRDGRSFRQRQSARPLMRMVHRREFDAALVDTARHAGVTVRESCMVRQFDSDGAVVTLLTSDGSIRARAVVGADGSAGRSSRYVGAEFEQVDVGLETHLALPTEARAEWRDRVHLDWGPLPGSYGWVFPKDDQLTVGVILSRRLGGDGRGYLQRFVDGMGLSSLPVVSDGGHLTHCRADGSPLSRGRVLLAGDAAGLLEPWTREGISFALRSGRAAGTAAARVAAAPDDLAAGAAALDYATGIDASLGAEMRAGRRCLAAFERHPSWFHLAMTRTAPGWSAFEALTTGRTSFAALVDRAPVRAALALARHS